MVSRNFSSLYRFCFVYTFLYSQVPDPENNGRSLYDAMVERVPDSLDPHRPL